MSSTTNELESKSALLQANLGKLGRVLIAYSGGIDSAYLAWAAHQLLGEKMLAIIADSPSLARTQLDDAVALPLRKPFHWKWSRPLNWIVRNMCATIRSAASSAKVNSSP